MREGFSISYPATPAGKKAWMKLYGANAYYAGKHWSHRKQDADMWHMMVKAAMGRSKCRNKPFEKPVCITFSWDDRLDLDNHSVMGKMIVDAMKGRMIQDDSRMWVKRIEHEFNNEGSIFVTVTEVE